VGSSDRGGVLRRRFMILTCLAAVLTMCSAGVASAAATGWAIQLTPNPSSGTSPRLDDVSCASATSCVAVGTYGHGASQNSRVLAERWNGRKWSILAVRVPRGSMSSSLLGVSCTSATACTAVGAYQTTESAELPLAEHWNGTRWSLQGMHHPARSPETQLFGVSCPSARRCTAVGYQTNRSGTGLTLAEHWNGKKWSVQATPAVAGSPFARFAGVSCSSSTSCTAAGWYTVSATNNDVLTLAEHWNGKKWSVQRTANVSTASDSLLDGISCRSASVCTAVGSYGLSSGAGFTLAERR
jgi:hypothetical protein